MAEIETRPHVDAVMLDATLKQSPIDILSPNLRMRNSLASSFPKFDHEYRRMRNTASESSILSSSYRRSMPEHRYFVAQFISPSTSAVRSRLDNGQRICLKAVSANRWHLSGTILARDNFEKRVFVRYTLDDWRTFMDVEATFLDVDSACGADRFHFRLDFPFRLPNETRLQLAVASCTGGQTHWDNNGGLNYRFTYNSTSNNSINE